MKVPPPKSPPGSKPKLVYDKDRTKTRRTVKGAAGGMLGVDYEDPGRADPTTVKATTGAGENRDTPGGQVVPAGPAAASHEAVRAEGKPAAPKEEAEMVLDDEDATTRDMKAKQSRHFVPRDRMTVDKDAPQLLRKRRPWEEEEEEQEERREEDPEEIDLDGIAEAIASAGDHAAPEGLVAVGDPRLLDPHAIKEALGSPAAYAKHCMILAEAFRQSTGAHRREAVTYLARLFAALGDRAFARQALKELGPGTGIVDLYPLEVVAHVLEQHPGLLSKVGFGRLFARPKAQRNLVLEAGVAGLLEYPSHLKIRGFALEGGGQPGYRFEPALDEGRYHLTIQAAGKYRLLISGTTRSGYTVIDRIDVLVKDGPKALPPRSQPMPPRDEAKVRAWPQPTPLPIDHRRVLDEETQPEDESRSVLSSSEIISMQQRERLAVLAEEEVAFVDAEEPIVEITEDTLSRAEASLLKMAVAVSTGEEDFRPAEEVTEEVRAHPLPED